MLKTLGISPKLAAAVAPPLTAVVTNAILTDALDRTSLAALAAIAIGALLGYHAPMGAVRPSPEPSTPVKSAPDGMAGTMGPRPTLNRPHYLDDPALDDPDHISDEPEIANADLKGRAAAKREKHTHLGDDQ